MSQTKRVAIIGTGPAGLMAAHVLAASGVKVVLFEKRRGAGRKLLVAGSSGLNISFDAPLQEFVGFYRGPRDRFERFLGDFPPEKWLSFIEGDLRIGTFKGTSRRYFVEGMKASSLLKVWLESIQRRGGEIRFQQELEDFTATEGGVRLRFRQGNEEVFDAACLALGGGSWEKDENPLRWPAIFERKGLEFTAFESSNCGFQVDWPEKFLQEAEGKPIKNVVLTSRKASRRGEFVVTRYGIEGTPVYFAGEIGEVCVDLKPDLTREQIRKRLLETKENLSPIRRVKRSLNLGDAAFALVFHLTPASLQMDLEAVIDRIKAFPLVLKARQPLEEAISSSGGVRWTEVDEGLMLHRYPGVFVAGEMLDWDAPTGGFLIQGCVSQGHYAAEAIRKRLGC